MKRVTSIILIVILILSISVISTSAKNAKTSDTDGMIAALNAVEPVKEQMGLSEDIDFEKLTYSDAVTAYEYTNEGPVINSEFIPIKYDYILVGWVIKTSGEDAYYQFTTAFASQVNEIADIYTEFAIIYDYNSSYLYDGKELYTLGDVLIPVEGRGVLENAEQLENADIMRKNIVVSYALPYDNTELNGRAQVYFSCNVDYVSQPNGSKLCWAASTACVVNYIKKTNHTAVSVAKSTSYSSSSAYTYVRPDSGITLTLCAATCRYWIP